MPLVSVVIPTYNREKIIGRTIQSVLDQTFQNYEIIIVDDGSTDNTKKVVEKFQSNKKVRYYYQHNQGAQVARNYGLSIARGEYIAFLDSDDWWMPIFLEESLTEFYKDDEIGCVYCWQGIENGGKIVKGRDDKLSGWIYTDALRQGYITAPSFMVIKKRCFDTIGEWDTSFVASQDDDICFRLAKLFKFKLIPKVLAVCCIDYNGANGRISSSSLRSATGWWSLWNKFESDVLALCGKKVIAKHFLECASNFYRAEMPAKCEEAIQKAVSYYGSIGNLKIDFEGELAEFISSGEIYCYGAGEIGALVAEYTKKRRYSLQAFVVTETSSNRVYCEYPVIPVDDIKAEHCKIIISTTERYHTEIEQNIKEKIGDVSIFKINDELITYLKMGNIL